jgi:peptidyl-prolyl cis-trans isomerase C
MPLPGPPARSSPPASWLRRALREPLLHFAVLGAATFGVWRAAEDPADAAAVIVVDRTTQERLGAELEAKLGRAPTEQELAAAIERWVDAELLYREGLALGLDRDDPLVRQRVIQKMEFVGDNLELPAEPDEATLRAFMAEHAARYAGPPRYDFVLVTLPRPADEPLADARAQQVLEQLQTGADPKAVATAEAGRVASGRRFSAANVTGTYGPEIGAALPELSPGQWGLVTLERGHVLVRLDAVHPGETPAFETMQNRVQLDWQKAQRGAALRRRLVELRHKYAVTREP